MGQSDFNAISDKLDTNDVVTLTQTRADEVDYSDVVTEEPADVTDAAGRPLDTTARSGGPTPLSETFPDDNFDARGDRIPYLEQAAYGLDELTGDMFGTPGMFTRIVKWMQGSGAPRNVAGMTEQEATLVLYNAINTATFGMGDFVLSDEERESTKPTTFGETLAQRVGEFGGFLIGPMKLADAAIGTKLAGKPIIEGITKLGVASMLAANENLVEHIEDPSFDGFVDEITTRLEAGAFGGVVGGKFASVSKYLPQFWQRAAANIVGTQMMDLTLRGLGAETTTLGDVVTEDLPEEDIANMLYTTMLDIAFSVGGPQARVPQETRKLLRDFSDRNAKEIKRLEIDRRIVSLVKDIETGVNNAEQTAKAFRRMSTVEKSLELRANDPKPEDAKLVHTRTLESGDQVEVYEIQQTRLLPKEVRSNKEITQITQDRNAVFHGTGQLFAMTESTFGFTPVETIVTSGKGYTLAQPESQFSGTDIRSVAETVKDIIANGLTKGEVSSYFEDYPTEFYPIVMKFNKADVVSDPSELGERPYHFKVADGKRGKPTAILIHKDILPQRRPEAELNELLAKQLQNNPTISPEMVEGFNLHTKTIVRVNQELKDLHNTLEQAMEELNKKMELFDTGEGIPPEAVEANQRQVEAVRDMMKQAYRDRYPNDSESDLKYYIDTGLVADVIPSKTRAGILGKLKLLSNEIKQVQEFGSIDIDKEVIAPIVKAATANNIPVYEFYLPMVPDELGGSRPARRTTKQEGLPVEVPAYKITKKYNMVPTGERPLFVVNRAMGQTIYDRYKHVIDKIPADERKPIGPKISDAPKEKVSDKEIRNIAVLSKELAKFETGNESPVLGKDYDLAFDEALNKIDVPIELYNKIAERMRQDGYLPQRIGWFINGLQDTALKHSEFFGKAGGRSFTLFIDGYDRLLQYQKRDALLIRRAAEADKHMRQGLTELEYRDAKHRINQALEARGSADKLLKSPAERQLYAALSTGYDIWKAELEARGYKTEDNYRAEVARRATVLEILEKELTDAIDVLKGKKSKDINLADNAAVNDAIAGKVHSRFLSEKGTVKFELSNDPVEDYKIYSNSVSKSLAFQPAMLYYTRHFNADVPAHLRNHPQFRIMREQHVRWVRGIIRPDFIYGRLGSMVMKARLNVYKNLLRFNMRAALDNMTQKDFVRAYTARDTWPVGMAIYKQRRNLAQQMPNLFQVIERAGKDKAFLTEISMEDLGFTDLPPEEIGKVRKAWGKVLEFEPFHYTEQTNWDYAEIMGAVDYVRRTKRYKELREHGVREEAAIEEALENKVIAQRALINAQSLSQQTQLMPGFVASPTAFRNVAGKILGMFGRFPLGQIENIVRSFNVSGGQGTAAIRLLRNGFQDEVVPVENLQRLELFRRAVDEVVAYKERDPGFIDVDLKTLREFRDTVKGFENDLAGEIKGIERFNKDKERKKHTFRGREFELRGDQAALWAKYAAKRFAYIFFFNVISNIFWDTFVGVPAYDKGKTPIERAMESAAQNLIPYLYDVRNPEQLLATPLLPSGSRKRQLVRWGMNVVPLGGLIDRMSGRTISAFVADLIPPYTKGQEKKKSGGPVRF